MQVTSKKPYPRLEYILLTGNMYLYKLSNFFQRGHFNV